MSNVPERLHGRMECTLEFDDILITYYDGLVETAFWRGLDILSRLTAHEIDELQEQIAYEMAENGEVVSDARG